MLVCNNTGYKAGGWGQVVDGFVIHVGQHQELGGKKEECG